MARAHWSDAWVGRPIRDCALLVERVLLEQFGRHVALPSERGTSAFGDSALIACHAPALAERTDTPEEGAGALLATAGRLQHIGLLVLPGGERHVLHATRAAGVVRHRARDLARHGYRLEGWYRWR